MVYSVRGLTRVRVSSYSGDEAEGILRNYRLELPYESGMLIYVSVDFEFITIE